MIVTPAGALRLLKAIYPYEQEYRERVDDIPLSDAISQALSTLTPREQDVLTLYYGLADDHTMTMVEVGAKSGVTGNRIAQIIQKALRKLRHPARERFILSYCWSEQ